MKNYPLNEADYKILCRYINSAKLKCTLRALYPNKKDITKAKASLSNLKKNGANMKHMYHVKGELERIADSLRYPSELRAKSGPWPDSLITNIRKQTIYSNQTVIESMSSYDLAKMLVFKGIVI